ncbi:MAG: nucleoside phosphorylase [Lachnospiraceae bacterium]|nr:nucleoside phosphorylase [Lachnospiraceae bacterium]
MILEEFDESKEAVVNPCDLIKPLSDMPKIVVSCFAKETFDRMVSSFGGKKIGETREANMVIPVYKTTYQGISIGMYMSAVGAPACVSVAEEIFAMGAEVIILFGTCGVLDKEIEDCSIIIPDSAIRDEGTSFHYAPASDEILVNPQYKECFRDMLRELGCKYIVGKTWTSDGIYRETKRKVKNRKEAGCICVDMECAAMAALAQFRGKEVFQFFYAADNLDGEIWDIRSLENKVNLTEKDRIAGLAIEFAARVGKEKSLV